jgi:hypothetical protein
MWWDERHLQLHAALFHAARACEPCSESSESSEIDPTPVSVTRLSPESLTVEDLVAHLDTGAVLATIDFLHPSDGIQWLKAVCRAVRHRTLRSPPIYVLMPHVMPPGGSPIGEVWDAIVAAGGSPIRASSSSDPIHHVGGIVQRLRDRGLA